MNKQVFRNRALRVLAAWPLVAAMAFFASAAPAMPGNDKGKGPPDKGQDYQPEQRILWKVPLAAAFSQVRPAVGPDGSVYAVDAGGNLYIVPPNPLVTADGVVSATVVSEAGGKGVDVGPDGTVYTGNESWIKAFHPDGTPKWTYTQQPRAFILSDVAVGPDGNVYAVASSGLGAFALADRGDRAALLWQNDEFYDRSNASYTEIAFGPGGTGDQMYFRVNQNTRGLRLQDGSDVFSLALGIDRPVVSPFDFSWHRSDAAYDPDGNLLWQFAGFPPATGGSVAALGANGTHYTVNQGFRVFAIDPNGREGWSTELDESVGAPDVDPTNSQLILPTTVTSTSPAALRGVDTRDGGDVWRVELPVPEIPFVGLQYVDTPVAFTPDGSTAYVIAGVAGGNATLFALSLDPAIPNASTLLRSKAVTLKARTRRGELRFSGEVTVTDENRAPISGATVTATWTSSNGLLETQTASTGGKGVATFDVTGPGGVYTLTVDGIAKDPYTFDPEHSDLSGSLAQF
jgi:hypothetical protein